MTRSDIQHAFDEQSTRKFRDDDVGTEYTDDAKSTDMPAGSVAFIQQTETGSNIEIGDWRNTRADKVANQSFSDAGPGETPILDEVQSALTETESMPAQSHEATNNFREFVGISGAAAGVLFFLVLALLLQGEGPAAVLSALLVVMAVTALTFTKTWYDLGQD